MNVPNAIGMFSFVALAVMGGDESSLRWTQRKTESSDALLGIAFGGGQFATVGQNGIILTSSDDGVTWIRRESGTKALLTGITYGHGQFAAFGERYEFPNLGDTEGFILTSDDGVNWVQRWSAKRYIPSAITHGNSTFVALGVHLIGCSDSGCGTEGAVLTSTDGVNWRIAEGVPYGWGGIAFGAGQFVAIAGGIWTSTDGLDWKKEFDDKFCDFCPSLPIAYGNGKFVVLGGFDGPFSLPATISFEIVRTPLVFTVIKQHWIDGIRPAIAYGNGMFVSAVSNIDHGIVQTSFDGLNWSPPQTIAELVLKSVAFGNGHFVAVGPSGEIMQSEAVVNLEIRHNIGEDTISLSLQGSPHLNYTVQGSRDLIFWSDVATITNTPSTGVSLEDLSGRSDRQFYRVISLENIRLTGGTR